MSLSFDFKRKEAPKGSIYQKGVYPPEFNDTFKQTIRVRDKYECALCPTQGFNLDVHHLNYTKYTVRVNCISLCRTCHEAVHSLPNSQRFDVARHLYAITQKREKIRTDAERIAAWSQ